MRLEKGLEDKISLGEGMDSEKKQVSACDCRCVLIFTNFSDAVYVDFILEYFVIYNWLNISFLVLFSRGFCDLLL